MNITCTVEPAFEPVTLAQVWLHLRLDAEGSPLGTPFDAELTRYITAARQRVEQLTHTAMMEQTLRLSAAGFPASGCGIALRPPVISVTSVQYLDADNALQTLAPSSWYVTDDVVPDLRLTTGAPPPAVYARPDAVRVTYQAGYAGDGSPSTQAEAAANVPQDLISAVLLGIEMLHANTSPADREALDKAREAICSFYRVLIV